MLSERGENREERQKQDTEKHIKHARPQAHKTHQNKSVILLYLLLCPSSASCLGHKSPLEEGEVGAQVTYPEISNINMELWGQAGSREGVGSFDKLIRPHSIRHREPDI